MEGSWDLLSVELQRSIALVLWLDEDRGSLDALMQTCRELWLLVSTFINKLRVSDMLALRSFPR